MQENNKQSCVYPENISVSLRLSQSFHHRPKNKAKHQVKRVPIIREHKQQGVKEHRHVYSIEKNNRNNTLAEQYDKNTN